ncbi:MAG: tetratricopeptide repeat protein, partial [Blastocatellia bacterium]
MTATLKRVILSLAAAITVSLFLVSCARDPQKAKAGYVQKGMAYMKKGQYSSAVIEYRNALKIDPSYIDAYIKLAQADAALGDGNS